MKRKALLTAKLSLLIAATAFGQTWDGGDGDNNWGSKFNWVGDTAPVNNGTANIIFAGTVRPTPAVNIAWSINSLTFNNTATAFTLSGSGLTIQGGGITNNDNDTQTFGNSVILGANQTWNTASGNLVMNASVSGSSFTLTKSGSNTLTLNGTNSYSALNITAGTVVVANTGALVSNVTVGTGTTLQLTTSGSTYNESITGTGRIRLPFTSAGVTNTYLTGVSNFQGTYELTTSVATGDKLTVDATVPINAAASAEIGSGTTLYLSAARTLAGIKLNGAGNIEDRGALRLANTLTAPIFVQSNSTIQFDGGGALVGNITGDNAGTKTLTIKTDATNPAVTYANVISDGAGVIGIVKESANTLTFTGTNTYTGGTTISAGTLRLGDGASDGSIVGNITNNSTLNVNNINAQAIAGNISGTGNLTKTSAGTLTLTGTNTYTGGTTISAGTLRLGDGTTGGSITGNIINDAVFHINNVNSQAITGNISGTGSLTKTSAGTLTLTGANTYSGGTTVNAGTLDIQNSSALGTGTLTMAGGHLANYSSNIITLGTNNPQAWLSDFAFSGDVLNLGTGAVTLNANRTLTINGVLNVGGSIGGGAFTLTKAGNGPLILSGANTYSGGTIVTAGTLSIGNASALGTGSLTLAGGHLANTSGSPITLSTNNPQTWNSNFSFYGYDLNMGTGAVTLNDNCNITVDNNTLTVGGSIGGGAFTLTKTGNGTLTLSGANTYSGGTVVNAGWLDIQNANALGAGTLTMAGGNLANNSGSPITLNTNNPQVWNINFNFSGGDLNLGTGAVTLNANRSVHVISGTLTVGGSIGGGAFALTKTGNGTLALSGANTYSGGTTVSAGTLDIRNANALGTGTLTMAGGNLANNSGSPITLSTNNPQAWNSHFAFNGGDLNLGTGAVTLDANRSVTVNSGTLTVGGAIGGAFSLTKFGFGTLNLTGISTYSGGTTINQGVLSFSNGALGSTGSIIINNTTLRWNSGNTEDISSRLLLINGLTSTVDTNGNDVIFANSFGGGTSGTLAKSGAGTLSLTAANNFTGGTTVTSGTLDLQHAGALGTGTLTMNGGALANNSGTPLTLSTVNFQAWSGNFAFSGSDLNLGIGPVSLSSGNRTVTVNSGNLTVGGAITNGTLTKMGVGSLTLTGVGSNYSSTNIRQGSFNITSGGTISNGTSTIGDLVGNNGTVNVGGGMGNSTWSNTSNLLVGNSGTGTLNITGGGTVSNTLGYIGTNTGSIGTVTVGGGTGNSTWNNSSILYIGNTGAGTLNITGGGTVSNFIGYIGSNSGSNGNVSVGGGTGTSTWTNSADLLVGNNGTGTLNITGGGTVSNTFGYIGFNTGSNGTVSVGGGTGTSAWTNSGDLFVGYGGVGTLNITGGGTVSNREGIIGRNIGSNGTVTVGGGTGNSSWTNTSVLYIGVDGTGTLNITGGGTVNNTLGYIGFIAGSLGTVSVGGGTGTSTWTNTGELRVGQSGTGTLNITGGGTVSNTFGYIGSNPGSNGTVSVGGGTGNSTWNNSFGLTVGNSGTGTLNITGGGTVSNTFSYIGFSTGSNGTVTVGGGTGNSTWTNTGFLVVGNSGTGTLNITGGGTVSNATGYIGFNTGSNSTVSVGGGTGNSVWTNTSVLYIGVDGTGTLNITGGGTVNNTFSYLGYYTGTNGTVTVGGGTGNSTWTNTSELRVGNSGTGTLNITGGGTVSNTLGYIGTATGSNGTVTVGGGTGNSTWTNTSFLSVGEGGSGTLNITGGGTVSNTIGSIGGGTGSSGTLYIGGGTGSSTWNNTQSLYIGGNASTAGGTGTLNLNSGAIVTSAINTRLWTTGTINSNGGTANLGNVIMSGGVLNITGGTVSLSNLTYTTGTLNFASGTLNYNGTGGAEVNNSGLGLVDAGSITRTIIASSTIDASKSLNIANTTTINAGRTLTINGGTFSTGSLVVNGSLAFNSGTLGITGAGGLTIGSGGLFGSTFTLGAGRTLNVTNTTTVNSGSLFVVDSGANFSTGNLANQGEFILNGLAAVANGSTVANTGLVRGEGRFTSAVTNNAGGELRAENGKRLKFEATNGTNAGKINLQGGTAEFTQPITNGSTGLITGRGTLMTGGTGLNNLGNVALSSGITDVFGDVVNNTGVGTKGLQISGNADVTFWDDVTNTSGLFRVSAGSSATFFGTYSGGSITGTGDVYFEGDVTPGFSPANVTLQTNTYFGPGAYLVMELGGTTLGTQYDHLNFQGTTTLAGTLDVQLINGFVPSAGNSFDLFDGTLSGTFDTLNLPTLSGGLTWNTSNLYTTGVLIVSIPGPNSWQGAANALWSATGSWTNGTVPSTNGDTALFANAAGASSPVVLDSNQTVNALSFASTSNFTIQPQAAQILSLAGSTPSINTTLANTGTQTVAVALNLGNDTTIAVNGGTLSLNSPIASVVGSGVTASTAVGTTLQLAGSASSLNSTVNVTNNGTLSVTGTAQTVGNISGAGSTTVSGAGNSTTPTLVANDIDQASLTISNGAYVRLAASGTSTSALTSLTMGTTANLDISDNDVVINAPSPAAGASTLSAVAASVNAGFAGGNGIVTNTFTTSLETVGFGLNDFLGFTSFGGVTVNTDSVLIKYTYFGDSNLDGFVTDDDLGYFLAGYGSDISANPWAFGDYNHDGFTTDDDLGFFLAAYGSTPGLSGGSIQAIPEPSTLVLGTLAGLGLGALSLRRRRTK